MRQTFSNLSLFAAGCCFFLTGGCCGWLSADETIATVFTPEIILPVIESDDPAPQPSPTPQPQPTDPEVVDTLAAGVWYVIQSDTSLDVRHYPSGLIDVLETQGPAKLLGRFADAPDKIDVRQFESEWLYVLQARGTGKTMLVLTAIEGGQIKIVEQMLTVVGTNPQPPPIPPEPEPDDVLAKCHEADRRSQIEILRQLAAKNLARDPAGLTAAKDFVNAERIRRRTEDFIPLTDAIGDAIFSGTVSKLADTLEGKP